MVPYREEDESTYMLTIHAVSVIPLSLYTFTVIKQKLARTRFLTTLQEPIF